MDNKTLVNDEKPLVSIIMATFNEDPCIIDKSIKSILEQTYKNIEIIVLDDSTREDTKEAIDSFSNDSRLKICRFNSRKGFVSSLNEGLNMAKGEYIARMDGDDISYSDRIEKEVLFLNNNKDVMVVGGQMDIINENDEIISHREYPLGGFRLWLFSCYRNPLAHPTVMIRRAIVDKGYRYDDSLKMSEDLDFWLRLLNDGYCLKNISDTVLKYRVQDDFTNKRLSNKQRKYMYDVRKRNFSFKHLGHSVLSVCAGWIFTHIPVKSIKVMYDKENKA